ncbi:Gfo/Idh/MocA family oxidoreductase [Solirubrobacter sp. CPCC 204708]|uniref:Gfo/Idh/MocA family oxidoreductase n=1 Tax=Solirubrobacter deserti TaxID=2282478 RepID=A0ABT4RIS8_9ACTN|nr:Gfo/Idh/MocA family oxidoreductase [Solirubrobacter deserti]MBE2320226.1 Gfo/Idh/MocA family oxidoreductase [Solirubrobacter deserti]MDA0138388.1 Gfo/Idh/MocA family oxidoreductase [Solirubrobacter deserti]
MTRFAIVGLGYWGPNLVRNLHELPDAELVTVCDLRPEALESIQRRYPAVGTTQDFQDVVGDDSIDAVVISTPVSTHHRLAAAALSAGKHVFVEKPLAASSAEALDLVEIADRNNVVLMPGHTFLYSPPVMLIRDLIRSGELGEIYFISTSRVNLGLHQPDVSVAWDLGPHDFSILRYWLGETPCHASALARGCVIPNTPDVAFINLEFPSGTVAHVELSWLAPSKLRRTTVVGSQKMVVYDDTSSEPVRIFDSGAVLPNPETFGEYKLTYRTGDIVSPRVDAAEPLFRELEDFQNAIKTGSTPRSSAHLGVEVVRMIEAVDSSLDSAGSRVSIGASAPHAAAA